MKKTEETPLSDHFSPKICGVLKKKYAITTVEGAQKLHDSELMKNRLIGEAFIKKLRSIKTAINPVPWAEGKYVIKAKQQRTKLHIEGLNPRQRNAIVKGFQTGLIQLLLNERYMGDIFKADAFNLAQMPGVHHPSGASIPVIRFDNQN